MSGVATIATGTSAVSALHHLSHSQVQSFTICPRKWHYEKVAQAPKERIGSALVFGCAVHDALAAVNEAALHGESIDAPAAFVGAWKTGVAVGLPIHYGKDDAGDLLEMGKALVVLYQPPNDIIGVEQPFSVELAGLPPIEGRIDVIRREGEDLILADLKTSGTKVVADTHAVEAQLGLYNIAYPATKHEIIVLGKLKTPTINTQNIIPWSVGKVHQHYTEIHHAMVHHVRYAVRGWQCVGCSFHNRCQKDKS